MITVDDFVIEEYLDSKVSKEYYANKDEIKKGIQKILYKGFANYEEKIEDEVEVASDFSLSGDTIASYTIKRR